MTRQALRGLKNGVEVNHDPIVGANFEKFGERCQPQRELARHMVRRMQKATSRWNLAGSFKHPLIYLCTDYMHKDVIQVPEKGTYKWQLFNYWSDEFRQTHADHSAYIALNFAGALDACRSKLQNLVQRHKQAGSNATTHERHARAIARLQNTMTGAAMSYENCFRQH